MMASYGNWEGSLRHRQGSFCKNILERLREARAPLPFIQGASLPAHSGKSFIHGCDDRHTSVRVNDSLEVCSHTKEYPGATAGASGVDTGLGASSQN